MIFKYHLLKHHKANINQVFYKASFIFKRGFMFD